MAMKTLCLGKVACVLGVVCVAASVHATPVNITATSSQYSQSFDSLPSSGLTNSWANDSTLPSWFLYASSGSAVPTVAAGTGSVNNGYFYSFGSSASDRALGGTGSGGTYFGSPASGAVAGWIAVALINNSGIAIPSFTVNFDGEQWRNGGNTSKQTMVMQYGFGSSFSSVSWVNAGSAFDFTSPIASSSAAALDGNAAANRVANLGGTITANWAAGSTLWFRWIENNDVGNDHGLAIDNFAFVAAVPEPVTLCLLVMGGVALLGKRH